MIRYIMEPRDTQRQLANLADERNGAALYRAMAEAEKDPHLAEIYRRFAQVEDRHAAAWEGKLQAAGVPVPSFKPSWQTTVLAWLARRLGVKLVLPTVTGMERSAVGKYTGQADAADMAPEEASHARLLSQMTSPAPSGPVNVAQMEGRHRSGGGNALRAAVLGANDGLVSNLSLVMGVAGAASAAGEQNMILITGLAGLLAGACSMALGEWLSVQSSRELYQRQIEIERAEIANSPQEEVEELALIYQSRGVAEEHARQIAQHIFRDKESALQTLIREELAIDPEELGGSAYVAAGTSFALFALGAVIPVIPFMLPFLRGNRAIVASAILSTGGLYVIGAAITLFTGKTAWRSGLRMVITGLAAAAITFTIGHLIGASLG